MLDSENVPFGWDFRDLFESLPHKIDYNHSILLDGEVSRWIKNQGLNTLKNEYEEILNSPAWRNLNGTKIS